MRMPPTVGPTGGPHETNLSGDPNQLSLGWHPGPSDPFQVNLASEWNLRRQAGQLGFHLALDYVHIADLLVGLALIIGNTFNLLMSMVTELFSQVGNLAMNLISTSVTTFELEAE